MCAHNCVCCCNGYYQSFIVSFGSDILILLCYYYTGTEQIVVGDLVYSKGDNTEERTCVNSECEDENCNDVDDCGQLDEVSAIELPVGRNNLVKVRFISYSLLKFFAIFDVEPIS